ncbi:hypothetical protein OUZ56_027758 [Daphnia magna]|uniref:Phospholipase A-2-activating protein n=1 Tax=Daphnia magna TaxID=35525 RepID=A0ABR0B2G8_9CRUS|nr:hypothetical protein OUZ56_027758 [Daphnia magna]
MSSKMPYKLRCSMAGHSKDVRSVTVGELMEECVVSGSRDKTAKLWLPEGLGFVCDQTYIGNEGYVSSVAIGGTSDNFPGGCVITGCQDGKIRVYNPGSVNPTSTFTGHSDTVCALITRPGFLLSGSWDKTARLWQSDGAPIVTLSGHAAAVWAIEFLHCPNSASEVLILTGSADKTIKLWKGDSPFQSFKGHTDCVRALAVCDSNRFLSAANDATIRLWITSGDCIATFYGHTNYIYGLCMMPDRNVFVSCGEDRSLRIWKLDVFDECQQTVFLPAQSVWSVSVMRNGDIVTGSSDGLVRIFTQSPERAANAEVLQAFEQELAQTSLNAQLELGGIKASDLPGPESLFEPGTREGQTKMVRNGETVSCYSWSSGDSEWTKVGDVVGAAGQSEATKNLYEGKEYDYVFSVDIEEGKPPLKLPYNTSEDPWLAAQKFIHKNDLSQYHLDTVANFIIQNSKSGTSDGASQTSNMSNTYVDPFTGGSRYVPSSGNVPSNIAMNVAEDPFTGSGRYIPVGQPKKPEPSLFPVKDFLCFDQAKIEAITSKLREFNEKVDPSLQLSDADLLSFVQSADPKSTIQGIPHLETFLRWPSDMMFPALDILRLASRHPHMNRFLSEKEGLLDVLLAVGRSTVPNCMMIFRTIAHLSMHKSAQQTLMDHREAIFASVLSVMTESDLSFTKHSQWKHVEVAVSTIILNFSILIHSTASFATEEEALFRTLVAVGTLLADDNDAVAIAHSIELKSKIDYFQNVSGKVGECSKQILLLLK